MSFENPWLRFGAVRGQDEGVAFCAAQRSDRAISTKYINSLILPRRRKLRNIVKRLQHAGLTARVWAHQNREPLQLELRIDMALEVLEPNLTVLRFAQPRKSRRRR